MTSKILKIVTSSKSMVCGEIPRFREAGKQKLRLRNQFRVLSCDISLDLNNHIRILL